MHNGDFEWNIQKNEINKKKHGLAFEDAILIFDDPYLLERYDAKHSDYEDRFTAIGTVCGILPAVVSYTYRENKTRIISARYATKKEERFYCDTINDSDRSKT